MTDGKPAYLCKLHRAYYLLGFIYDKNQDPWYRSIEAKVTDSNWYTGAGRGQQLVDQHFMEKHLQELWGDFEDVIRGNKPLHNRGETL